MATTHDLARAIARLDKAIEELLNELPDMPDMVRDDLIVALQDAPPILAELGDAVRHYRAILGTQGVTQ